jgi:hypothetical protein
MPVRVLKTPMALRATSLLQEEGCSFHHEEALAQAEKEKSRAQLDCIHGENAEHTAEDSFREDKEHLKGKGEKVCCNFTQCSSKPCLC